MKQSDDSVEKKRLSLFGVCFLVITYWWAVVLFPLFTALFPITWVMDRVRRRLLDKIAFLWMRLTLFCCRVRVVIQGEENLPTVDRPVMYVANHQSFLDIYVLSALKPKFKFVSKIEVFSYPIIGKLSIFWRNGKKTESWGFRWMMCLDRLGDGVGRICWFETW